jgi:hypothetical protein
MQSVVRSSLIGLLALASLTACGDKVNIVQPSSTTTSSVVRGVTVTPASVPSLAVGSSVTLSAAVEADAGVTDRTVTWSSSDATVASVDATGKVTGVKAGTVTISAAAKADPTVKGAALVTVGGAGSAVPVVTISSINNTICGLGGCNSVPANLANAANQLDVILNVEANGQALKSVSATLKCGNDSVTQTQTISNGDVAALDASEAAAPVTLSFNTAAFTINTAGAAIVALHNGQCTLSTTATTTSGAQSATNSTTLTLANLDGVVLANSFAPITNAEGVTQPTTATDAGGLPWRAGSVTILATPVLYSNRTVSSVSITLPGAQVPTQTVTAGPFSATWSGSSTSGTAPTVTGRTLVGSTYEANGTTPVGITPSVVVLDAAGNDLGLNVVNAGIVGNTTFRLDNTAPQAPLTFTTPSRQAGWVNGTYTFTGTGGVGTTAKFNACGDGGSVASSGVCQPQIGVSTSGKSSTETAGVSDNNGTTLTSASFNSGVTGLTTFTYYSIPAVNYTAAINTQGTSTSATTCATTGWTKIATGGDLAATLANNIYVVRVFETDKLGNARCTDLANNLGSINTGGYSLATVGKFGVDKVAPTAAYIEPATDATAAPNLGMLPVGGNIANFNIKIGLSDDASGFSAAPVNTMVQRLAIDPATGVASTINTAFGCPNQGQTTTATSNLSNGACSTQTTAANVPGNFGVTVVDGTPTNPGCAGCGYYFFTQTPLDLARNTAPVMTRNVVVDQVAPIVGGIAVPATVTGGTSASFATSATDNLDLISSDYTLTYAAAPAGGPVANLPIRATGPALGVAFDNTLTTASSFSVAVPFFIRSVATTGAGNAPLNNGGAGLPATMAVRVYDAAGNASAPGTTTIAPANVPQAGRVDFTVAPAGANPGATMINFQVSNSNLISNCPAAGCTGGVAPVNATSVTLTATATGNEGANFQFINPFSQVQFYYFDTVTNEYVLIGAAVAPVVTDNAGITIRTFTWTLSTPFDPPAALGTGALRVVAIGVSSSGDGLASAVSSGITMTNP